MTDVIQRNAANIVALSVLLFTNAVTVTDNTSLAPTPAPPQDALRINPFNLELTAKLLTA
jgi:hypothetical protein